MLAVRDAKGKRAITDNSTIVTVRVGSACVHPLVQLFSNQAVAVSGTVRFANLGILNDNCSTAATYSAPGLASAPQIVP